MSVPNTGVNSFFNSAIDESPAVDIFAKPTLLFNLHVINPNTTDVFIQLFNALAANVTVGTTTPQLSYLVPGGTGASNRGAFAIDFAAPISFATALSCAVTTDATGSGAPASDAIVNVGYLAL